MPRYLHTPLVMADNGDKLSKPTGAPALDLQDPLRTLAAAAAVLGLPPATPPLPNALQVWAQAWAARWLAPAATGAYNPVRDERP
jgi:glutamyl-Q tRNA(Asp) synthetase